MGPPAAFGHWRDELLDLGIEYGVDVGADDPPASGASSPDTRAAWQAWKR